MPDKDNLSVEELHARMLKKQLWVVMTKAVAPPEEVRRHLKAHLEHQIALEKAGIMYGAGSCDKTRRDGGVIRPDHHPGQGRDRCSPHCRF